MARDFIKINVNDTNAIKASLLARYVREMRQVYSTGKEILGIMNHNNDGSVWTDIEELFGLPSGKGNTVYDLMNGSVGALEGTFQNSNAKDLTEALG